jgi:prepilin-type N-terminal cleavage/methylation domain-containing protein
MKKLDEKKHKTKTKAGFTIIEISIVIIVLGFLVGGVLVGSELIKQSELSSIATEYNLYSQAVNTFELKYNGLPGDLKDATEYFGAMAGSLPYGEDGVC